MKTPLPSASTAAIAMMCLAAVMAPTRCYAAPEVTDDDLALARDPIIIKTRLKFGDEHSDFSTLGGSADKMILSGVYGFGFNCHDRNFGVGFELPYWNYSPEHGDSGSGWGDLKLRCGQLWVDQPGGWRAGWFYENEFDTAARQVQPVANQRDQMDVAVGAAHPFLLPNLVLSATMQFGWSMEEGETNGSKSEWEGHLTAIYKINDCLSMSLDYKGVYNTIGENQYFNTLEPGIGWIGGPGKHLGLNASLELPLYDTGTNWIAKAGVTWFF